MIIIPLDYLPKQDKWDRGVIYLKADMENKDDNCRFTVLEKMIKNNRQ
jgi:hypothetical protein